MQLAVAAREAVAVLGAAVEEERGADFGSTFRAQASGSFSAQSAVSIGSPKTLLKAAMCQRPAPGSAEGMRSSSIALWVATAATRPGCSKAM